MLRIRALLVATALMVIAIGGTMVPAHARAASTSPQKWVSGVCSAVQDWVNSVQSTLKGLKNAGSLSDASQAAINGIDSATTQLGDSLEQLGKPSTSNGTKARSAIQNLSNQLQTQANNIKQELADPPSDPVGIASTFAQIGTDAQTSINYIKSTATTLKQINSNGELKKAFQNASSCQSLKKTI